MSETNPPVNHYILQPEKDDPSTGSTKVLPSASHTNFPQRVLPAALILSFSLETRIYAL